MSWANPTLDHFDDDVDFSLGGDGDGSTDWATVSIGDESWSTPEFLDLSTDSTSFSQIDLLEEMKTASRNGTSQVLSSLSQFANILARTGIHGPRHLKAINLKNRAVKIGNGTQFTVFKEIPQDGSQPRSGFMGNEGLVIKRVKLPLSREAGKSLASGNEYRSQLRSLELEILALCNPSIRGHRNIVHLDAWGYDYPYPDTPVPVLFMEAAIMTLTDFLKPGNGHLLGKNPLDVKHQLALDVAAGLEAMHRVRIVHGDIKCDNVLVFKQDNPKVLFCAKLNDFGICIDMETPGRELTIEDYMGTPAWLAPEVRNDDDALPKPFNSEVMLHIDSYSFGLVVLSIFTQNGEPPALSKDVLSNEEVIDSAIQMLRSEDTISSPLRMQLTRAIRGTLAADPWSRPLPCPDLLKADNPAYAAWFSAAQIQGHATQRVGTMDPSYNQGPRFWYKLDPAVFMELEEQYAESERKNMSSFPAEVLFGMAQKVTGMKPSYLERLVPWIRESAKQGFSPARAVYAQVMHAHGEPVGFESDTLDKWVLEAVAQGYLFSSPSQTISEKGLISAKERFRSSGGFCSDTFFKKPEIIEAAKDEEKVLRWQEKNAFVDHQGNTMLHVAAALGLLNSIRALVETAKVPINGENNNQETALYKACQAGHVDIIHFLLDNGASASKPTKNENLTPLHWIFTMPESSVNAIGVRLIKEGGALVNAAMIPTVGQSGDNAPRAIPILHFPFEFPYGTPLHWAAFARNTAAMEVLLDQGADIDATYVGLDASTTPLALAVWYGEVKIAKLLLSRGANGKAKDAKSRNLLHLMTFYLPDRHGNLPQPWHYWIRHGNWAEHLEKMTELSRLLANSGADIEAKDDVYPKPTPIIAAASLGVWRGGAICGLLELGADVNDARGPSRDSVLHLWAGIVAARLDYPTSYLDVLSKISDRTTDIDLHGDFDTVTPLHMLALTYHTEKGFEDACQILLSHEPPANINAADRRGLTPLYSALSSENGAEQRAIFLANHGANLLCTMDSGADIFVQVCSNTALSDQQSHDLILLLLSYLEPESTPTQTFSSHFLHLPSSVLELIRASATGRLKTLTLLLSTLGLHQRVNDFDPTSFSKLTALDHALQAAEYSRRQHIVKLSAYAAGPARTRALENKLVYDSRQGAGPRAAEAYESWPSVLALLVSHGARRACDIDPDPRLHDKEYIEQPGMWDLNEIFMAGFTPQTQPNRENWTLLYELARYPVGWKQETLELMKEQYADGIWRPSLVALEEGYGVKEGEGTEDIGVDDLVRVLSNVHFQGPGADMDEGGNSETGKSVWIRVVDDTSNGIQDIEVEVVNGELGRKRAVQVEE